MRGRFFTAVLTGISASVALSNVRVLAQDSGPTKQNARGNAKPTERQAPDPPASDSVQYSYEFKQPVFYLKHIVIKHDQTGRGELSFEKLDGGDPIVEPVQLSSAALGRIVAIWGDLHFLESQASYQSEKQFPHLGTMWLSMTKGAINRVAEFNWTNDKSMAALVQEYQHLSNQIVFIFDISVARQNQPLEAPKLMDSLDTMVTRKELSDAEQLVPLLQDLANDEHIPLMARNHATRIVKKIEKQ